MGNDTFVPIEDSTVKQLQSRLKLALNKISEVNYSQKIGPDHFDILDCITVRKQVKNAKLRNIFYRLINKDFFDSVKMKKYKMTESDTCERCQQSETTEHLLWECRWSRLAWESFNEEIRSRGAKESFVKSYKDIYNFNNNPAMNTIKLKIINELIQITRPKNLHLEKVKILIKDLMNIEKYIAKKNNRTQHFQTKWKLFIQ
jgi:hypothetical protein